MRLTVLKLFFYSACVHSVLAQAGFVYLNNDYNRSPNSVAALAVSAGGTLSVVPGSPFPTGGLGGNSGVAAAYRIISTTSNRLYVSNSGSHNITVFSIDPGTGVLSPLSGPLYATGGSGGDTVLTMTPDEKFLYAGNYDGTITAFQVANSGGLQELARYRPGNSMPDMKVTNDGRYLIASLLYVASTIAVLKIEPDGTLTSVPGSPFPAAGPSGSYEIGMQCNCASTLLFADLTLAFNEALALNVYQISSSGSIVPVAGTPFIYSGKRPTALLVSSDDRFLYAGSEGYPPNWISGFAISAGGSLSQLPDSPFAEAGYLPFALAANAPGTFVYLLHRDPVGSPAFLYNSVSVYRTDSAGNLSLIPGSTFLVGSSGTGTSSIAAFPPRTCCPAPSIGEVTVNPSLLWPPNGQMVLVTLDYDLHARCQATTGLSVTSNQPSSPNGTAVADWSVIDDHHILLRSARAGQGDRVYTITIKTTNVTNGYAATASITVTVPHDQGK